MVRTNHISNSKSGRGIFEKSEHLKTILMGIIMGLL